MTIRTLGRVVLELGKRREDVLDGSKVSIVRRLRGSVDLLYGASKMTR